MRNYLQILVPINLVLNSTYWKQDFIRASTRFRRKTANRVRQLRHLGFDSCNGRIGHRTNCLVNLRRIQYRKESPTQEKSAKDQKCWTCPCEISVVHHRDKRLTADVSAVQTRAPSGPPSNISLFIYQRKTSSAPVRPCLLLAPATVLSKLPDHVVFICESNSNLNPLFMILLLLGFHQIASGVTN